MAPQDVAMQPARVTMYAEGRYIAMHAGILYFSLIRLLHHYSAANRATTAHERPCDTTSKGQNQTMHVFNEFARLACVPLQHTHGHHYSASMHQTGLTLFGPVIKITYDQKTLSKGFLIIGPLVGLCV